MSKETLEIQEYLRFISAFDEEIPSVVPDGKFGAETAAAVQSFQKKHGLEANGRVDLLTWEKILSEYDRALFEQSEPVQIAPIKKEDLPLKINKASPFNHTLKLMLNSLAESYSNFRFLEINESFDAETKSQIESFQQVISVTPDGEVDKETWNKLAYLYLN